MANSAKTESITDYAMPLMNIERMAKDIYNLCLDNNYSAASEAVLRLGTEARVLSAVLAILENKDTLR